jgi:hypothetical protein
MTRARTLGIGLIAALAGYALVQATLGGGDSHARELSRTMTRSAAAAGSRLTPVSYGAVAAPSTTGAVAAATRFLQLLDDSTTGADPALRALTLPPLTAQALRGEATATAFKRRLGPGVFIHGWRLGWAVDSSPPGTATVAIWTVGVVAGTRVISPPVWSTTTCRMRVVDGEWRVAAANTVPGPTPPASRTDWAAAALFAPAADRFHVFGDAP